jgi:hypothetical protein
MVEMMLTSNHRRAITAAASVTPLASALPYIAMDRAWAPPHATA